MRFQPSPRSPVAGLLFAGLLLPGLAYAQTPDQGPAPPVAPAPDKPDAALLNKAVAAIVQTRTLVTTTEMQRNATGQGMTFVFRERLHVVLQKPGKYHSDITLLQPDGTLGAKYTIISDGVKVWVYQPGTKTYAVLARSAYQEDDLSGLGLFNSLITDTTGGATGKLDLSSLTRGGVRLQGGTKTVGGVDYQIFSMTDPKQGYKFRLLLDPQAATVHELDLDGRQGALTFTVQETIKRQSPADTLPVSLFYFAPPPGVRRVPKIGIGPF